MQYLKQKGFTIIELLVVIAIIGLITSIILISLRAFGSKGRDAKRVAELKQLQSILAVYFGNAESYPIIPAPGTTECAATTTQPPTDPGPACPVYAWLEGPNPLFPEYMSKPFISVSPLANTYKYMSGSVNPLAYRASVFLEQPTVDGQYYCVDSTAKAKYHTNAPDPGATVCP